jgi:hypothetical protein
VLGGVKQSSSRSSPPPPHAPQVARLEDVAFHTAFAATQAYADGGWSVHSLTVLAQIVNHLKHRFSRGGLEVTERAGTEMENLTVGEGTRPRARLYFHFERLSDAMGPFLFRDLEGVGPGDWQRLLFRIMGHVENEAEAQAWLDKRTAADLRKRIATKYLFAEPKPQLATYESVCKAVSSVGWAGVVRGHFASLVTISKKLMEVILSDPALASLFPLDSNREEGLARLALRLLPWLFESGDQLPDLEEFRVKFGVPSVVLMRALAWPGVITQPMAKSDSDDATSGKPGRGFDEYRHLAVTLSIADETMPGCPSGVVHQTPNGLRIPRSVPGESLSPGILRLYDGLREGMKIPEEEVKVALHTLLKGIPALERHRVKLTQRLEALLRQVALGELADFVWVDADDFVRHWLERLSTLARSSEVLAMAHRVGGASPVGPGQDLQPLEGKLGRSPLQFLCTDGSHSPSAQDGERIREWLGCPLHELSWLDKSLLDRVCSRVEALVSGGAGQGGYTTAYQIALPAVRAYQYNHSRCRRELAGQRYVEWVSRLESAFTGAIVDLATLLRNPPREAGSQTLWARVLERFREVAMHHENLLKRIKCDLDEAVKSTTSQLKGPLTEPRRQTLRNRIKDLRQALQKWTEIEKLCETMNLKKIDNQLKHAGVARSIDHTHARARSSRYTEHTALEARLFEASAQRIAQVYETPPAGVRSLWTDWLFDTALRPLLLSVEGRWLAVSRSEVFTARNKKGGAYLAEGLSRALGKALPYFTDVAHKVRSRLGQAWEQEGLWLEQESERTVREAVLLLVLTRLGQAQARRVSPTFDADSTDGRLLIALEGEFRDKEQGLTLEGLRLRLLDELEGLHWSRYETLRAYVAQERPDDQRRFALEKLKEVVTPRRRVLARARDPEATEELPPGTFGVTAEIADLANELEGENLASYRRLLSGWFLAQDERRSVTLQWPPAEPPAQPSLLDPILRLMWLSGALGGEVTKDLHEQQQRLFAFVIRPAMYLGGITGSAQVLREMPGLPVDFPSSQEDELSVGNIERLGFWCAHHRRDQWEAAHRFPEPALWAAYGASVLPVDDPLRLATLRTALYGPLFTYCIGLAGRSEDLLGSQRRRQLEDVVLGTFFRFQRTTEEGGWDDKAVPELHDKTERRIDSYFLPHALHCFVTELWELLDLLPDVVKDLTDDRDEDIWTRPLDKAKFLDKLTLRFIPQAPKGDTVRSAEEPAPDLAALYEQLLRALKFPLDFATAYLSVRGVGGSVSREDVLRFVELFSLEHRPGNAAAWEEWVYENGLMRLHNGFLQWLVPKAARGPLPDSLEDLPGWEALGVTDRYTSDVATATWKHPLLPRLLVHFARVVMRQRDRLRQWDTYRSTTFPFDTVAGPMILNQAYLLGFEGSSADGEDWGRWALGVAQKLNESLTHGSSFDGTWPERARLLQGPPVRVPPPAPVSPQSPDNQVVPPPPLNNQADPPPPPDDQASVDGVVESKVSGPPQQSS